MFFMPWKSRIYANGWEFYIYSILRVLFTGGLPDRRAIVKLITEIVTKVTDDFDRASFSRYPSE
jgi:hypothetical protein